MANWWEEIGRENVSRLSQELGGQTPVDLNDLGLGELADLLHFETTAEQFGGGAELAGPGIAIAGVEREAAYQARRSLFASPETMQRMPFRELQQTASRQFGVTGRSRESLIPQITSAAEMMAPSTVGMPLAEGGDIVSQLSGMSWQEISAMRPHLSSEGQQALSRLTARRQEINVDAQRLYGMSISNVEGVLTAQDWEGIARVPEQQWQSRKVSSPRGEALLGKLGTRFQQLGGVIGTRGGMIDPYAPRTRRELVAEHGGTPRGRVQIPSGVHGMSVLQAQLEMTGTSQTADLPADYAQRGAELAGPIGLLKQIPGHEFFTDPKTGEEMMQVPQFEKGVKRLWGAAKTGIVRAAGLETFTSGVVGQEGGPGEQFQIARHRMFFGPEMVSGAGFYGERLGRFQREIVRRIQRIPKGAELTVSAGDVLTGGEPLKLFEGHKGISLREEGLQDITVQHAELRETRMGQELVFQGIGTMPSGVPVASKFGGHKEGAYYDPAWTGAMGVDVTARINEPYQAAAAALMAWERTDPELARTVFGEDVLEDRDEEGKIRWQQGYGQKFVDWLREKGTLQSGWLPEKAYNIQDPLVAQAIKQKTLRQVTQPGEEGTFQGQEWNVWVDYDAAVNLAAQPAYDPNKPLGMEAIANLASTDPELASRLVEGTERGAPVSMLGASLANLGEEELTSPEARLIAERFRERAVVVGPAAEGEQRPVADVQEIIQRAEASLTEQGYEGERLRTQMPEQMMETMGEMYPGRGTYFSEHGQYAPGAKESLAFGFQNIEGELTMVPRTMQRMLVAEGQRQLGISKVATIGGEQKMSREDAFAMEWTDDEEEIARIAREDPEAARAKLGEKLFEQMTEVTASKDFTKSLFGAGSGGTGGGGWVSPVEGMPLNRWTGGQEVLQTMVPALMRGRKSDEEVQQTIGRIMSGEEDLRASIWRDPSLTKEQRRSVASYMTPRQAMDAGIVKDMAEYESRFGSTIGVAPAAMSVGAGDWDLDVMTRRARTTFRKARGGWQARHSMATSTVEDIQEWLAEEPGGEHPGLQAKLAEFGRRSMAPVRAKLKKWSGGEAIGTRVMAAWTRAREGVRGRVMGGIYNLMQRQIGSQLEGTDPALERGQNLLATGYQLALDYELEKVGPLKDQPDKLEAVRGPIQDIQRLAGLKATTFGWKVDDPGEGEEEFGSLRTRERGYVDRAVRAFSSMRGTGGELGSAEARAALLIHPERAPEEFERVKGILEELGVEPFDQDPTAQQLKQREDALKEIGQVVMPEETATALQQPGRLSALMERTSGIRALLAGSYHGGIRKAQQANITAGREEGAYFEKLEGGGMMVPSFWTDEETGETKVKQYRYTPEMMEAARLGQRQYELTGTKGRIQRWAQSEVLDPEKVLPRTISAIASLAGAGEAAPPLARAFEQVMETALGPADAPTPRKGQPEATLPSVSLRTSAAETSTAAYEMSSITRRALEMQRAVPRSLGGVTAAGGIRVDRQAITDDYEAGMPHLRGEGETVASQQKAAMLKMMGIGTEELGEFFEHLRPGAGQEAYREMVSAHEQAHIDLGHFKRYPRTAEGEPDLMSPRAVGMEAAATRGWLSEKGFWKWQGQQRIRAAASTGQPPRKPPPTVSPVAAPMPGRPSGQMPGGGDPVSVPPMSRNELERQLHISEARARSGVSEAFAIRTQMGEEIESVSATGGIPGHYLTVRGPRAPMSPEQADINRRFLAGQEVFEAPFQRMTTARQFEALEELGITGKEEQRAAFRIGAGKTPSGPQWAALSKRIGGEAVQLEQMLTESGLLGGLGGRGGLDKMAGAVQKATEAFERNQPFLEKFGDVLKTQTQEYEAGERKADRAFGQFVGGMGTRAGRVLGAAQAAMNAGMQLTPEQQQRMTQWQAVQGAAGGAQDLMGLEQMGALAGGGGADGGPGGFQAVKRLMIGWTPMQMRRAMGMFRDPQAIGMAAQAEIPGWGLTQAIGGAEAGLPGGVAGGVMQYQAARRQAQIQGGRAQYRAWGAGLGLMDPLRTAQGIAGGPLGAGLAAGIGLNALGGMAMFGTTAAALAGPVGLAIAGGGALLGGAGYLSSFGTETAENQLAASGGPWGQIRSTIGYALGGAGERRTLPGLGGAQMVGQQAGASWSQEQGRIGQQLRGTQLDQLTAGQRMAVLNYAAQNMEGGVWEGMDEGQRLKALSPYASMLGGMTGDQIAGGMPEWVEKAIGAGMDPGRYTGLAQQMGMGVSGRFDITQSMTGGGDVAGREAALTQYAGLSRFGISAAEIMGNVQGGRWGELTGQQGRDFGRLMGGDQAMWSQYARMGQAPSWAATRDQWGFGAGTLSFADLNFATAGLPAQFRGLTQQLGGPEALSRSTGGAVPLLGGQQGQIDYGGMWGLQQWGVQEGRAYQDYQVGQQFASLYSQRQHLAGGTAWSTRGGVPTSTYQRGMWDIQDDMRDQQRASQMASFGVQGARLNLQWEQTQTQMGWGLADIETGYQRGLAGLEAQAASVGFGYRRQMTQLGWKEEDIGRQWGRQGTQWQWQDAARDRQWGRQQQQWQWQDEDFSRQRAVGGMQFGWQMEDLEEGIRFASGRQRKQLITRRERATTMYGIQEEGAEEQLDRMKEQRAWSEEDHEIARFQTEQRRAWSTEDHDTEIDRLGTQRQWAEESAGLQIKQLEERRKYLDEDHTKALERHSQKEEWATESHELSQAQLGAAISNYEEMAALQDEQQTLQRDYQLEQMDRQEKSLVKAQEHRTMMETIQDLQDQATKNQAISTAAWNKFWAEGGAFMEAMEGIVDTLQAIEDQMR